MSQAGNSPARHFDAVVVGSGVAGCSVALALANFGRVALVTKAKLEDSTTRWAQGGIAAVLGGTEDSTDLHFADTVRAGAGLCDEQAVRVLVEQGPRRVHFLAELGADFDIEAGGLARAREGGHSRARVVHAGGAATGAEVGRALGEAVRASAVEVLESSFVVELLHNGTSCSGVEIVAADGVVSRLETAVVVLASGGLGQLFEVTTNPPESTGDGVALALRAGVALADLEFVQFHPTALHVAVAPRPLLSEALRGEGALLLDASGERFVDELAPRNVVSRAIAEQLGRDRTDHVLLDARPIDDFDVRFPTIAGALFRAGLDAAVDLLPVAPAAHHLSGGVLTDLGGASSLAGCFAVGEVACTGVHGANRLASNSLLEGLVFAQRCADRILAGELAPQPSGALAGLLAPGLEGHLFCHELVVEAPIPIGELTRESARQSLGRAMSQSAGVVRTFEGLASLAGPIGAAAQAARRGDVPQGTLAERRESLELANLALCAVGVVGAALQREETRGAHARAEFPNAREEFRHRIAVSLGSAASTRRADWRYEEANDDSR